MKIIFSNNNFVNCVQKAGEITLPKEKRYGIDTWEIFSYEMCPTTEEACKKEGLRKVDYSPFTNGIIYTHYPFDYLRYKILHFLARIYWQVSFFLYREARFFQHIPEEEVFSWKYFTPYVWAKKVLKAIKRI